MSEAETKTKTRTIRTIHRVEKIKVPVLSTFGHALLLLLLLPLGSLPQCSLAPQSLHKPPPLNPPLCLQEVKIDVGHSSSPRQPGDESPCTLVESVVESVRTTSGLPDAAWQAWQAWRGPCPLACLSGCQLTHRPSVSWFLVALAAWHWHLAPAPAPADWQLGASATLCL